MGRLPNNAARAPTLPAGTPVALKCSVSVWACCLFLSCSSGLGFTICGSRQHELLAPLLYGSDVRKTDCTPRTRLRSDVRQAEGAAPQPAVLQEHPQLLLQGAPDGVALLRQAAALQRVRDLRCRSQVLIVRTTLNKSCSL